MIQITDDPSAQRTAPPCSTHVQPDDVSHALIQQGERERLRKTPSSSSTTAWWWRRSVAILQGFAKHLRERRRCHGREGGATGFRCGCPSLPSLYIGARERGEAQPCPFLQGRGAAKRGGGVHPPQGTSEVPSPLRTLPSRVP